MQSTGLRENVYSLFYLEYTWPWAGPKKAHGRKLRPRPSQALPLGLLFKPKPSPSSKKPLGLRAVGRASSLKCQYICQAQARPSPAGGLKTQAQARPMGKPIGPRPWILRPGLGGPTGPGLRWPSILPSLLIHHLSTSN
mgnify:CR=1 FL=1